MQRWADGSAGTTPTGFKSKESVTSLPNGKTKKSFYLEADENEQLLVITIFNKYLELKSLTKLETYLIQNDIKTRNGKNFSRFALKSILTNPVYAVADENMLNYFEKLGLEVYANKDDFDGIHGIIAYNKTTQTKMKTKERQDACNWIISIGLHKGLIRSKTWISVQELLSKNADKSYRKPKTNKSILSGILYCQKCGSIMRPKIHHKGSDRFSYICDMKMKSNGERCNQKNINGYLLDKMVADKIKQLITCDNSISKWLKNVSDNFENDNDNSKLLQKILDKNKKEMNLLIDKLKYADVSIINEISKQIIDLKEKNRKICIELEKNKSNIPPERVDFNFLLNNYIHFFDSMDLCEKRSITRILIKKILVTDDEVTVVFNEMLP